jgi:hypothetical protein
MTLNDHTVHGHDDGLDDNRAWTRVTCKVLESSPFLTPFDPAMWSRLSEKAAFLAFNIETATVSSTVNGCDGRKRPAVVGRFRFNEKAGLSATRTRMVIDWYSQYSTVPISLCLINLPPSTWLYFFLFYFNHSWSLSYLSHTLSFTSETTHRLMPIVVMGDLNFIFSCDHSTLLNIITTNLDKKTYQNTLSRWAQCTCRRTLAISVWSRASLWP